MGRYPPDVRVYGCTHVCVEVVCVAWSVDCMGPSYTRSKKYIIKGHTFALGNIKSPRCFFFVLEHNILFSALSVSIQL